jgi:hypothetical protein
MGLVIRSGSIVIPRLGRGIHALGLEERKAWIPEPSSGMTAEINRAWEASQCSM